MRLLESLEEWCRMRSKERVAIYQVANSKEQEEEGRVNREERGNTEYGE